MKKLQYSLIDVFTDKPFGGNQLAVFHGEEELSSNVMQQIARELDLSETVFICPPVNPRNQKCLRIFTPKVELPLAGHPTIGAAFSLADQQMIETIEGPNEWILEEKFGDIGVTVYKQDGQIIKAEMTQPLPEFRERYQKTGLIADLLSLTPRDLDTRYPFQTVSSGLPFLFIPVRSLNAIRDIRFRTDIWEKHFSHNPDTQHIFVFTTQTEEKRSTVHCRMFAPAMGIAEDPATGAASGPLGAYLVEHGVIPKTMSGVYHIRTEQGFEIKRPSYINVTIAKSADRFELVKIGGTSVTMGRGEIYLTD